MNSFDAGLLLGLSVALLAARHTGSLPRLAAGQAVVLAAGAVQRGLYPEAVTILLLSGAVLPWLLHRLSDAKPIRFRYGIVTRWCAAAVLVLLAVPFGIPLAVVMLGILATAASRDRVVQVAGLLVMQNGIALAGLDGPAPERLAAMLPLIPALACAALWASRRQPA